MKMPSISNFSSLISVSQMPLGYHCILITALKCIDESIPTLSYSHYVPVMGAGDLLSAMFRYSYPLLYFNKLYLALV